jgi:hypothetical protein
MEFKEMVDDMRGVRVLYTSTGRPTNHIPSPSLFL